MKNIKKINLSLILTTITFFTIVSFIAYYDYFLVNQRNIELYSVVFLSSPRPVSSWDEFVTIFDVARRFRFDYFNGIQRTLLGLLTLFLLINLKKPVLNNYDLKLTFLIILGLLSIILLFGVQYMNHDYYFIGNFMPIILFLSLKCIAYLSQYIQPRTSMVLALCFAFVSFSQGNTRYFQRMSEVVNINGDPEPYPFKWIENSKDKLEPYFEKEDLVFVTYVPEPNHSLVYLRRNGATFNAEEMSRDKSPFNFYMERLDAKFVICKTEDIEQLKIDQPEFIAQSNLKYKDQDLILFYHGH
ncbi:MAG: hypothetical protein P8I31_06045 [Bacteroidia bacterium]|nr:hypothetical protein [Bacteroidia bacterium]